VSNLSNALEESTKIGQVTSVCHIMAETWENPYKWQMSVSYIMLNWLSLVVICKIYLNWFLKISSSFICFQYKFSSLTQQFGISLNGLMLHWELTASRLNRRINRWNDDVMKTYCDVAIFSLKTRRLSKLVVYRLRAHKNAKPYAIMLGYKAGVYACGICLGYTGLLW